MSEETRRPFMSLTSGRHTRLPDIERLRRACLTTMIALVVQFGLGMWLNLYVTVPSADQHSGFLQEVKNGPLMLTVHALVGTFLIGAAIVLVIRTRKVQDSKVLVLASIGLGAILGAFASGELFVRDGGEAKVSLSMAVLTGLALVCYVGVQALTGAARMAQAGAGFEAPPERAPRLASHPAGTRPRHAGPSAATPGLRPDPRYAAPRGPRQPGYGRAMPGPVPASRMAPSGPQPAYPARMSGPQPAYPPRVSGPQPAYPPRVSGPQPAYPPKVSGPQPAYPPKVSGPQPAYPPTMSGPQPAYLRAKRPQARPGNRAPQHARPENTWQPWQPDRGGYGYAEES